MSEYVCTCFDRRFLCKSGKLLCFEGTELDLKYVCEGVFSIEKKKTQKNDNVSVVP